MAAISIPTTAIPRVPSFSDGGFGVVCVPLVLGLKCGLLLNGAAQDDPRAQVQQIAFGLGGSCSPNFETRHSFVSVSQPWQKESEATSSVFVPDPSFSHFQQ